MPKKQSTIISSKEVRLYTGNGNSLKAQPPPPPPPHLPKEWRGETSHHPMSPSIPLNSPYDAPLYNPQYNPYDPPLKSLDCSTYIPSNGSYTKWCKLASIHCIFVRSSSQGFKVEGSGLKSNAYNRGTTCKSHANWK